MINSEEAKRSLAECTDCGSIYAAWVWPDESVQIMGERKCKCGSIDFEIVGEVQFERV